MKKEEDPYKCCVCGEKPIKGGSVNTRWGNCHRTKCYPFNPLLVQAMRDKKESKSTGCVRYIEISRCCDCDDCQLGWECQKTGMDIPNFGSPIPEWCPLPKIPNK